MAIGCPNVRGSVRIAPFLRSAVRSIRDSGPLITVRRRLYERRFARTHEWKNLTRGVYRTFDEARRAAPSSMPVGYALDDESFVARTRMEPHDYPAVFWLREPLERGCVLLDLGGHVGLQYYLYRDYVPFAPSTRWIVCEQAAVAARGRELAGQRGATGLSFVDALDGIAADAMLTAGTIQFIEEALAHQMRRLARLPGALLVNKVPLHDRETCVTLQNTGRSFTPCYLFNAGELIASIEALGYRLRDRWQVLGRSFRVPFHPGYQIDAYSGLYFEQ